MTEMDAAMTTNLWEYGWYSQPLCQRYCYDGQSPAHRYHHHHHHRRNYLTPDTMPPIVMSTQPYRGLDCTGQPPTANDDSVPAGSWKVVRAETTADDRQWPFAAATGHALGRATNSTASTAAQHGWAPHPGIGA